MATGLEALGAASAVLQVISFSCSVANLCYKIYDGKPTVEHDLEDYASRMIKAAGQVQTRCQVMPQRTDAEKKLAEIGLKCHGAALALEKETQYVTQLCRKGRLRQAFWATVRSSKHRKDVNRLQKSLDGYTQVMEMQLMLKLCTMADEIELKQSQGFRDLVADVRALVLQIANGCTKIEDLIKAEHNTTRDHVTMEAERTRGDVKTHVVSQVLALGVRAATDAQRERLLGSLKADVMNQRYNNVMDSNAATFERVFLSYDHASPQYPNACHLLNHGTVEVGNGVPDTKSSLTRMSGETASLSNETYSMSDETDNVSDEMIEKIDQEWCGFISWLQSDNNEIFWIRGKPGSGKSTLMKFVIDNDTTQQLLDHWRPGTRILSHFFWKIGSPPQNSIKGLMCSLLHRILRESSSAIDKVLHLFRNLSSMDSYHDWSAAELENILFSLFDEDDSPVCIFIDGLDEISDQDGFFKLLDLVKELNAWDHVKVCVSSRPETQLVQMFQTIGATSIHLEDLTRPEMSVHVHKKLQQFNIKGQISSSFLEKLTSGLLDKAQGVFLWLFLATRSLINGIQNRDDEETLLQRLEQLPGELKELYADMWRRLNGDNSVYRETAARYLRYAVTGERAMGVTTKQGPVFLMERPTLLELTLAERVNDGECLNTKANDSSIADLKMFCEMTAKNISTRCAGLLQLSKVGPRRQIDIPRIDEMRFLMQHVGFIHRTAHDFLVETQAGQDILNYKHVPALSVHTDVALMKSALYVARILHREFNLVTNVRDVTVAMTATARKGGVDDSETTAMLSIGLELWKDGVISSDENRWKPHQLFVSLLAAPSPLFDGFVLSTLKQADSSTVLTDTLRDICAMAVVDLVPIWQHPPTRMMQKLMSMGADPHAIGLWNIEQLNDGRRYTHTHQVTAYGLFLTFALNHLWLEAPDMSGIVDVIDTMTQTCPNWQTRILFHGESFPSGSRIHRRPWSYSYFLQSVGFFCEVDLQFLLVQFLAAVDSINPAPHDSTLHNAAKTLTEPVAIIRYISSPEGDEGGASCYRILDQKPFQDVIGVLFDPQSHRNIFHDALSLVKDPALAKQVDIEAELDMLAEEVQGFAKISNDEKSPQASSKDTE